MKTKLFVTIERVLARVGTDRIIVISEQQRREIHEEFRVGKQEQLKVIPLGLDTAVFADWELRRSEFRRELDAKADELLIGIVGRLTEIKNHKLFLEAASLFKLARKENSRVRFVIIGDGHLRAELEAQARALALNDDVVFTGTRQDPENFYPALDIVALTSRNEGTPLTLIEAMLNARPVIATAVGGVVDLLGTPRSSNDAYAICERGIRITAGDAQAFAAGIARLVEDESMRMAIGETGRRYVSENYAKERLLNDIVELYQTLGSKRPEAVPVEQTSVCSL